MANSLKLSDSTFWDSVGFVMPRTKGGTTKYYLFDDTYYEIAAGYVTCADLGAPGSPNSSTDIAVTFPRTFSKAPVVVVGNACDNTAVNMGNVEYFIKFGSITTTGFTAKRNWNARPGTGNRQAFSYIAINPKNDYTGADVSRDTGTSDITGQPTGSSRKEYYIKTGRIKEPTALSTGTSLKMSNNNFWDLSSIRDDKTASTPLSGTYYTFDYGTTSVTSAKGAADTTEHIVNFNKVFKTCPIVVATMGPTDSYLGMGNTSGKLKVGAVTTDVLKSFGDTSFGSITDGHKQFKVHVWNNTTGGSSGTRTVTINWVAVGLADN